MIFLLSFVKVQLFNEAGHVYAALGAGARGDSVKLAIAQLMRGRGAEVLLQAVRDNVEKELDEVYNLTEKMDLPPPRRLTTLAMPRERELFDHLLEFVIPKINCTKDAIMNMTLTIIDWERRLRASVDEVQAAVGARELQIRQRHVLQMEQVMAAEEASQLLDATGPKHLFDKSRRSHGRQFRQISRTVRRLHRGEILALHIAGRMFRQLQIAKTAIAEDRMSRFIAKLMAVFNDKGEGSRDLVKWANDILADGYILELEESRLMSTSGAMMGAVAVTTEETLMEMLSDLLVVNRTSELDLAMDLATARRNARVFTHRAIVELKTLFSYNLIVEEALKIVRIPADEARKMFRTEQGILEGRLDHDSYWGSNSSDYDLAEQIKRKPKHTKLRYPKRFFLKAKDGFTRIREAVAREFDKAGFLFERHNESSHLEANIHVTKKIVRETRALADDIEHLAEGEAAFLLAQEHMAKEGHVVNRMKQMEDRDRAKALQDFAIAKRALERFVSDEPKHFHSGFPELDNLDDYKDPKTEAELREEYNAIIAEARKNQTKLVTWGKYGHRAALRSRIFRQGVAVDREVELPFDFATRKRLDRLERAIKGERLYWSVASRRRQAGESDGELRLAVRVQRYQGALRVPAFPREELQDRNGVNLFAHYADPLIGVSLTGAMSPELRNLIRHAQYLREFQPITFKDSKKQMMKAVHLMMKKERDLLWQAAASVHDARKFVDNIKHMAELKKAGVPRHQRDKRLARFRGKAWEIGEQTKEIVNNYLLGSVDKVTDALQEIVMGVKAAGHEGVKTASKGLKKMATMVQGKLGDRLKDIAEKILNPSFVSINSRADRKPRPEDLYSDNRMKNLENFMYEAVPRIQIDFHDAKKTISHTVLDIEDYFHNFPLNVKLPDEPDSTFLNKPF